MITTMEILKPGDTAPDFTVETTEGNIRFHKWLGHHWGVLFSRPVNFAPVSSKELSAVAKIKEKFEKRNVKVVALSADPLDACKSPTNDINETQHRRIDFPCIFV